MWCGSKSPSARRTTCVSKITADGEISERSSGGIQESAREKGHDGEEREQEGEGREGREENKNPEEGPWRPPR